MTREQHMMEHQGPTPSVSAPRALQGLGVSEGRAIAPALLYRHGPALAAQGSAGNATPTDPRAEAARLDAALAQAAGALRALATQVERDLGADEAGIFEAQALMLEDPALAD